MNKCVKKIKAYKHLSQKQLDKKWEDYKKQTKLVTRTGGLPSGVGFPGGR